MEIWKFPLKEQTEQVISLPAGFKPLTIQRQGVTPCLWVMIDPTAPTMKVTLFTFGTGWTFDEDTLGDYLGTYQTDGGAFVWHVFQAREPHP